MTTWIDPRPAISAGRLAARGAAHGRRLLFVDNGKIGTDSGEWRPVEAEILAALGELGEVSVERHDLLRSGAGARSFREPTVASWTAAGIDGVVLGLCDAGTTTPTISLAADAERAGIPAVVLCTGIVGHLGAVQAHFEIEGLQVLVLPVTRLDDAVTIAARTRALAPAIVEGLTADACTLVAAARSGFALAEALGRSDQTGDFQALAARDRMTDGLPVATPWEADVAALLAAVPDRDPDDVLIEELPPSGAALAVRDAAVCAVMAGCSAAQLPLVLAALEAMADPEFQLPVAQITTHPGGTLILFSGPAAQRAGVAHARGCLGPGNAANLSISRAVSLALLNRGRAIPGEVTLCALGSPAQLSYCFADAPDGPLPPLHRELAGDDETIVMVQKCEGPHNVIDHSSTPEGLLRTIASVAATPGGNNAFYPSDLVVILNPEHAALLSGAGWSRAKAREVLWEYARNPRTALEDRGMRSRWPPEWDDWDRIPVAPEPERIRLVVAGGPGPSSLVAVPWGLSAASFARVRV